jgi:feruloyl esterase
MVYNDPTWNYETFAFGNDIFQIDAKLATTLDPVNPDLRAFKNHGGKILQSHLWSSTQHAALRSIEYYDQVVSFMNANDQNSQGDQNSQSNQNSQGNGGSFVLESQDYLPTQRFYRLFMAPGGTGSKGPGTFDSLPYLENWVEQGISPTSIVASHFTNGVVDRTRPLCPYPAFEVYLGSSSTDEAANFKCNEPPQVPNYFVLDNLEPEPLATPGK